MREDRVVTVNSELAKKLKRAAAMQDKWLQERDELIIEARQAGGTLREIAALAGITHVGVHKIVVKYLFDLAEQVEGKRPDPESIALIAKREGKRP
jgi:DNA-directed RNA polymerase specialized sigma subunit